MKVAFRMSLFDRHNLFSMVNLLLRLFAFIAKVCKFTLDKLVIF